MELTKDLDLLDASIRKLQIEWDKFFGGVEKKPPNDLQKRVEVLIRRYAGIEITNNTDRFRYQALTARFNTFNELWNKRLRALEEGRTVGLHLTRAMSQQLPPPPAPEPASPPPADAPPRAARPSAPSPNLKEYRIQNPAGDGLMVRALFRQFVDERKKAGEMAAVSYESFEKLISNQATKILTEKGAQAVDFRVESKEGKVSLKVKPVK